MHFTHVWKALEIPHQFTKSQGNGYAHKTSPTKKIMDEIFFEINCQSSYISYINIHLEKKC